MRYCSLLLVPMLMLSTASSAQSTPATPPASDQWTLPATTSTAANDFNGHMDKDGAAAKSRFKFKRESGSNRYLDSQDKPWDQPPPSAQDRTSVMGGDRPWSNGRPPVNCAQTPMDPVCR